MLLSSKYDNAMESVQYQLQDIKATLKVLVQNKSVRAQETSTVSTVSTQITQGHPRVTINGDDRAIPPASEGYSGESSFNAHVRTVADMLGGATNGSSPASQPTTTSAVVLELLDGLRDSKIPLNMSSAGCDLPAQTEIHELRNLPLPPTEPILKLLRSTMAEKHRFFIDVPIIDEEEFFHQCQKVYFSVEPLSILTWSVVNVGLLYLLYDLNEDRRVEIGMSVGDIHTNVNQLSANINVIITNLKLFLENSTLACQALGLLVSSCFRNGDTS